MKAKTKLSKYTITAAALWGVCAVLFGVGYFAFYQPQKAQLTQLEIRLDESQGQLEQALTAARDQTKEKMQQRLAETCRLIDSFATQQNAVTGLVFEIGQIANELRLKEYSSKNHPGPDHSTVGDGKSLTEAWLNVEFVAAFDQFSQFLNRLERNCPVVFVEEMLLRRGNQSSEGHQVTLKLSFLAETDTTEVKVASATP